ncbi:MAG TPA: AraC family transcriptional regulator [Polyangiaceae bacterium]|nr:AraC family transcriptional regulator [Polyangiaceae bacterium]
MDPFAHLPPDAITLSLIETDSSDELPDGWRHDKVAPATIIAIARRGWYEVSSGQRRAPRSIAGEGEAFLAQDREPLQIIHHGRRQGEQMRAHWLHARFTLFHTIDLVSLFVLPPRLDAAAAKPFVAIIEQLQKLQAERQASIPLARHVRKVELGFRVLSLLAECADVDPSKVAFLQQAARLAPVLTFINSHLSEAFDVEDLARAAHLSRSRFFAFFQEHMGRAPMAYVKEVRLTEVRKRLTASDEKLSAVAEATGFSNPFHLSREFKRQIGMAPGEFRKRYRTLRV